MTKPTLRGASHSTIIEFGRILATGLLFDVDELFDYFEKPWKWDDEYQQWISAGRPRDAEFLWDMV